MRIFLLVPVLVLACGGRANTPTLAKATPSTSSPAVDLARAKASAKPGDPKVGDDPRIELDIIRITASTKGVGGDTTAEHVATSDLFKQAADFAKAKQSERALGLYRKIVAEFPDSKYAPVSLFNVAAILDGRGELDATIATLADLVQRYPDSRESIDGHLYIAALQAEHKRWQDAATTLDQLLARPNLTYSDRIEVFAAAFGRT